MHHDNTSIQKPDKYQPYQYTTTTHDNKALTLLNGRTLTATLTQSLPCMSAAVALIVLLLQPGGTWTGRRSDGIVDKPSQVTEMETFKGKGLCV